MPRGQAACAGLRAELTCTVKALIMRLAPFLSLPSPPPPQTHGGGLVGGDWGGSHLGLGGPE